MLLINFVIFLSIYAFFIFTFIEKLHNTTHTQNNRSFLKFLKSFFTLNFIKESFSF